MQASWAHLLHFTHDSFGRLFENGSTQSRQKHSSSSDDDSSIIFLLLTALFLVGPDFDSHTIKQLLARFSLILFSF